jgi:hypothetical protein
MTSLDHPRLRAWDVCPLCAGHKARGLVACWDCFNEHDPEHQEEVYAAAERALLAAHRKAIHHITQAVERPIIRQSGVRVGLVDGKRTVYSVVKS